MSATEKWKNRGAFIYHCEIMWVQVVFLQKLWFIIICSGLEKRPRKFRKTNRTKQPDIRKMRRLVITTIISVIKVDTEFKWIR